MFHAVPCTVLASVLPPPSEQAYFSPLATPIILLLAIASYRSDIMVARLPNDVLVYIFVPLSPLVVSHVCRRWRAISLSVSHLWSTIPASNAALTRLFIDRCRSRHFHFEMSAPLYWSSDGAAEAVHAALNVSTHVRSLTINVTESLPLPVEDDDESTLRRVFERLEGVHFSSLTMLSLSFTGWWADEDVPNLPASTHMPNLCHLGVVGGRLVNREAPRLFPTSLTSLTLVNVNVIAVWPDLQCLTATLATLPMLQTFELSPSRCIMTTLYRRMLPIERVHLPQLGTLSVRGDVLLPMAVFGALVIPTTCSVSLRAPTVSDDQVWDLVYRERAAVFAEQLKAHFTTLNGWPTSSTHLHAEFCHAYIAFHRRGDTSAMSLPEFFIISFVWPDGPDTNLWRAWLAPSAMRFVRSAVFNANVYADAGDIYYQLLPGLTELIFDGESHWTYAREIYWTYERLRPGWYDHLLAAQPGLTCIVLRDLDLSVLYGLWSSIKTYIAARSHTMHPVALKIQQCDVSLEMVGEMAMAAGDGKVDWDECCDLVDCAPDDPAAYLYM